MAVLYGSQQYANSPAPVNTPAGVTTSANLVIDGTPVRVAMLAVAAALGLAALKWAGFRFNVGVS